MVAHAASGARQCCPDRTWGGMDQSRDLVNFHTFEMLEPQNGLLHARERVERVKHLVGESFSLWSEASGVSGSVRVEVRGERLRERSIFRHTRRSITIAGASTVSYSLSRSRKNHSLSIVSCTASSASAPLPSQTEAALTSRGRRRRATRSKSATLNDACITVYYLFNSAASERTYATVTPSLILVGMILFCYGVGFVGITDLSVAAVTYPLENLYRIAGYSATRMHRSIDRESL